MCSKLLKKLMIIECTAQKCESISTPSIVAQLRHLWLLGQTGKTFSSTRPHSPSINGPCTVSHKLCDAVKKGEQRSQRI